MIPVFANPLLLLGASLVAVPIVLHLIMRRKPKLLEFPALRFVQRRHDTNQRKLQLRHLLLLLLRAAAIALLALALARPSMKFGGALGSQEAPVAAALVFDAAPHMQYRHENKTRLEVARDLGLWLLQILPKESQIAVMDTRRAQGGFDADRGLSKQRIERLDIISDSRPLVEAVSEAAQVLAASELAQKEIYVFTDLSRSAWPATAAADLQDRLQKLGGPPVHVIDVGVVNPVDFALGDVRLSHQVLSHRGSAELQTAVSCLGTEGQRTVELHLLDANGTPQKRDEQTTALKSGEAKELTFQIGGLETGVHQGFVRLIGQDGLAADDERFFTVAVKPAWPVLVAAARPAKEHAIYLTEALAPEVFRKRGQASYDCQVVEFEDLPRQPLEKYAAVCLLDPIPLEPAVWQKLADYASTGHGVAVFLGRNANPVEAFNVPAAGQILPGKLLRQAKADTFLAPRSYQHPVLKAFSSRATSVPWGAFPVLRYWELTEAPHGANVIVAYADNRPAIIERPVGSGRAVVMTTPVSDVGGDRRSRDVWNYLPVSAEAEPWPFLILANEMLSYLVGGSQQRLNYSAGETVVFPLDPQSRQQSYLLVAPGEGRFPLSANLERHELAITATELAGNYRVQGGGKPSREDRGFSVNIAPEQTELRRVDDKELAEMFGRFKFRLARTREQIDRSVNLGRVGRELYPALILVVALALAVECVVANRFYKEKAE